MRRLVGILLVGIVALLGFYVAWPLWSGHRIAEALKADDAAMLAAKVDFPRVRASLKPALEQEVQATIERVARDQGGVLGGLIASQFKGNVAGRVVEAVLDSVVTPESVVRAYARGTTLRDALRRVMAERTGGRDKPAGSGDGETGGATTGSSPGSGPGPGGAAGDATGAAAKRRHLTLANVKRVRILGPLAYSVGVARDAETSEPDVTVTLAFTNFDWRVVGLAFRD